MESHTLNMRCVVWHDSYRVIFWHASDVEPWHPHFCLLPPYSLRITGATRVCHAPLQEWSHQRDAKKWFRDVLERRQTEAIHIYLNGTQMCVCTQTPSHIRESLSPTLFETHKCTQARSHKHLVLHLIQPDHEKNTETAPHKFGLSHAQKQGGCLRHPPVSDVACMQTLTQRLWQKMAIC